MISSPSFHALVLVTIVDSVCSFPSTDTLTSLRTSADIFQLILSLQSCSPSVSHPVFSDITHKSQCYHPIWYPSVVSYFLRDKRPSREFRFYVPALTYFPIFLPYLLSKCQSWTVDVSQRCWILYRPLFSARGTLPSFTPFGDGNFYKAFTGLLSCFLLWESFSTLSPTNAVDYRIF